MSDELTYTETQTSISQWANDTFGPAVPEMGGEG